LSRQESNQRNAFPVAHRPSAGSLRASLKPGVAQLASRLRRDWLEQVLAHGPGLGSGARLAPTGERQRQQSFLPSGLLPRRCACEYGSLTSIIMASQLSRIEQTLRQNIDDVQKLMQFDHVILNFAITTLTDLRDALSKQGIHNPAMTAVNTLQMLKNVRENDSLRSRYEVIFNQCVVLIVSVFASAVADLFREGINVLVKGRKAGGLREEELHLKIGDIQDMEFDLTGRLGHLLAEKKDISFQDMKSIHRAFRDYFDVELQRDRIVNNIFFSQASRHIIVHDAARINDRFTKQIAGVRPRDIKGELEGQEMIQFDPNEVRIIADSMLSYFSDLRKKVEAKLGVE
jgi:hypothetical protein